jgi:hypothetical protein
LGKTVEAIALILSNRHPLSQKRARSEAIKAEPSSSPRIDEMPHSSSPITPTARARKAGNASPAKRRISSKSSKPKIPVIDLTTDLDLSGDRSTSEWWHNEREAFQAATVYDSVADIHVSQVAVSDAWVELREADR